MKKLIIFVFLLLITATKVSANDLYIEIVVEECILNLYELSPEKNLTLIKTYPVASFKPGLPEYPIGMGYATKVEFDPFWYPTDFSVEYMNDKLVRAGKQPAYRKGEAIRPGDPRNAMGKFKIHLSHSTPTKGRVFRIHGTNDPSSIGKRVSGGCTRMKNEEGLELAEKVKKTIDKGKTVRVEITMKHRHLI